MIEPVRPQTTIRRMLFACWITNATDRHTHTHTHWICKTCCSSTANNGYANAPRCYVYTCVAYFVLSFLPLLFRASFLSCDFPPFFVLCLTLIFLSFSEAFFFLILHYCLCHNCLRCYLFIAQKAHMRGDIPLRQRCSWWRYKEHPVDPFLLFIFVHYE